MTTQYFTQATLDFLRELERNNTRDWFQANKQRYEKQVRGPALAFIDDIAPQLQLVSPRFLATPKKVGGSLMRVHRDTRFSRDKTPYKTNIGIQFRHEVGKDVHAPGYYLHIESGNSFLGVGIWRPDSVTLGKIREAIDEKADKWLTARDDTEFSRTYILNGESLKSPPRGYAKDHPLLQDLKRKDFIGVCELSKKAVLSADLLPSTIEHFERAMLYMRFLCQALEINFD
jgi:uncharacterized protein (TIGR02453 family)